MQIEPCSKGLEACSYTIKLSDQDDMDLTLEVYLFLTNELNGFVFPSLSAPGLTPARVSV